MKTKTIPSIIVTVLFILGIAGVNVAQGYYWADSVYYYETLNGDGTFAGGFDINGNGILDAGDTVVGSGMSPSEVLGAPDPSFISIYEGEAIVVGFSTPFINGPGDDFAVVETGDSGEAVSVWVFNSDFDDWAYIEIGATSGPQAIGSYGYYNTLDLVDDFGLAPDFQVSYVAITDGVGGYSPGFDLTGIGALYPDSVPEPATLLLLGSSLIGIAGLRRKFRKK